MLHPGRSGGGGVPRTVLGMESLDLVVPYKGCPGDVGPSAPIRDAPPAPSGLAVGTLVTTMHFVTAATLCLGMVFLCFGFHSGYSTGFSCTLLLLVTGRTLLCDVSQRDPLGRLHGAHPAALSHPFLNRTGGENTWKNLLG